MVGTRSEPEKSDQAIRHDRVSFNSLILGDKFFFMNSMRQLYALLIAASFLSCSKKGETTSNPQNDLPPMTITTLEGSPVFLKELTGKIVLIFFQPDCDHCQREAEEIEKNLKAFSGYALYFISSNPGNEIEQFAKTYKLSGRPNVTFAQTTTENVITFYGPIAAPSVYIYSNDGQLVKAFNGQTDIQNIINFL